MLIPDPFIISCWFTASSGGSEVLLFSSSLFIRLVPSPSFSLRYTKLCSILIDFSYLFFSLFLVYCGFCTKDMS